MATRPGTQGNDLFRHPGAGPTVPGQILLTDESDIAFGFGGDDTMLAFNAFTNAFYGGDGNDSLVGGAGGGLFDGGTGNDTILAGSGNATLTGGAGADSMIGGAGGDVMIAGSDADTLAGEGGNDSHSGESGLDLLMGGEGQDTLDGGWDADTLDGGLNNDKVTGGRGDDSLIGGLGHDSLDGGAGFDTLTYRLTAGIERVVITTGSGRVVKTVTLDGVQVQQVDLISGIESFVGTAGADRFVGGGLDEQFRGGAGNDSIDGGGGGDWARYDSATAGVVADLATGLVLDGEGGTDRLRMTATAGDNSVEHLAGGIHADILAGDLDGNWLRGNWGRDTLDGGGGFDLVDYSGDLDADSDGFGVTVNLSDAAVAGLAAGTARDANGDIDELSNFEAARGTAFRDRLIGHDARGEQLRGMAGADTIEGGLGNDAAVHRSDLDANNDGFGVVVNLSGTQVTVPGFGAWGTVVLGARSARDGWGDTDSLVGIESAHGTFARDVLVGAQRDVTLRIGDWMFASTDRSYLRGAEEADTLRGLSFEDNVAADYRDDPGGIVARIDQGWVEDGWGFRDTLVNIFAVSGSVMDDLFIAGDGYSWMRGAAGDDTMQGGAGQNYVSYAGIAAPGAVTVNLAEGWAEDGFGGRDELIDIEGASGDGLADHLVGNEEDNLFLGGAGPDTIDGAGGSDWAHWYWVWKGVSPTVFVEGVLVNLAAGFARDGDGSPGGGSRDTLISIENAIGSHMADTLIGTSGANQLHGMEGDDRLEGGFGADTMVGGVGNDTFLANATGDLVVELAGGGTDLLVAAISVTLSAHVEHLQLTGGSGLRGTGNAAANRLEGNGGANMLTGATGADTLLGGAGADTLLGGLDADLLRGDAGADIFRFDRASESGRNSVDRILDFTIGTDRIALEADANRLFSGPARTDAAFASVQAVAAAETAADVYAAVLPVAASGAVLQLRQVEVASGAAAGTWLYVNDGVAGVSATADMLIRLDLMGGGVLGRSDILLF